MTVKLLIKVYLNCYQMVLNTNNIELVYPNRRNKKIKTSRNINVY